MMRNLLNHVVMEAVATEGGAGGGGVPEANLRGENQRLRAKLATLESNGNVAGNSAEPSIDNLVDQLPDSWEDPKAYAREILRIQRQEIQRTAMNASQIAKSAVQEETAKDRQQRKQDMIEDNVVEFKKTREWTSDPVKWNAFAAHMNTIYGVGKYGELTLAQFEQQEYAFRGGELVNEALSKGQEHTLNTIQGRESARSTRTRPSTASITEMSIDEQLDALAEVSGKEQVTLYNKIKDKDPKRAQEILRIIDKDTQDDE